MTMVRVAALALLAWSAAAVADPAPALDPPPAAQIAQLAPGTPPPPQPLPRSTPGAEPRPAVSILADPMRAKAVQYAQEMGYLLIGPTHAKIHQAFLNAPVATPPSIGTTPEATARTIAAVDHMMLLARQRGRPPGTPTSYLTPDLYDDFVAALRSNGACPQWPWC